MPYPILKERLADALALRLNPEVYMDGSDLDTFDPSFLKLVKEEFSSRGLRITQHGPYIGLSPGDPDKGKRAYTVERYRRAFEAASYLGPVNIVLHGGYSERKFKGGIEEWVELSLRSWPEFVKAASGLGVTIAAENIFEKEPSPLKALAGAVASPNFRLCIDSGHLNVFSNVDSEVWIKELGPLIAELHIHDNNGATDEHLPVGEGTVDFPRFFSLLKKYAADPVYTIEPHGEDVLIRALSAIKKFLIDT